MNNNINDNLKNNLNHKKKENENNRGNNLSIYENGLKLEQTSIINLKELKKDDYFNDLINALYEENLINDYDLEKLNYERMKNLQVFLKYYTRDESSSVTVEAAEDVFKSLNFTLGIYMHQYNEIDEILSELKSTSIESMLEKGRSLIKEDLIYTEGLLKKIQNTKLNVGNYSYDDTIDYGLGKFFKTYNDLFSAHSGDADIDYQLAIDIGNYQGIEYMKYYLERLYMENEFCSNFDPEQIKNLLYGYDDKYELLLLNIFEIILVNCIGHVLAGNENIKSVNITKNEKELIKNYICNMSEDELKNEFKKSCLTLSSLLKISDRNLISYMEECSEKIVPYIFSSIEHKTLDNIFISFNENIDNSIIEYVDKESMSNERFRYIAELVRNADNVKSKIEIINTKISSLKDLNDILDADCLFDDEYSEFFLKLPKMQVVLLLKYIEDYGHNKEWHEKFFNFVNKLSEEDTNYINSIKNKIHLI